VNALECARRSVDNCNYVFFNSAVHFLLREEGKRDLLVMEWKLREEKREAGAWLGSLLWPDLQLLLIKLPVESHQRAAARSLKKEALL